MQTWIYPDGTKGTTKPKDGEVFWVLDNSSGVRRPFQWDDVKSQWFDISHKSTGYGSKQKVQVHTGGKIRFFLNGKEIGMSEVSEWRVSGDPIKLENPKCECGSEKAGSNRHSSWCKKFTPNA